MSDEADMRHYLYVARDDSQPIFHGIQEDMAQLNDFCLLCVEGTSKHLAELQHTAKRYRTGEERAEHPNFGDISDEVAWSLEEFDIPLWQDTERFMVRAMCLILLSAFVEKCLKDLAVYFAPPEAPRFKRKGREGEIVALLSYLHQTCALDFEEPALSQAVREECRNIRNDFAHGRWDEVKASIADRSLSSAFGAVTALFDAIDEASAIES
jgi:hypothetical protein